MYKINKLQHGKCFVRCLRTRCFVSKISLVRCAHSFDFWYVNNSCVNTIRAHFPWSNLYILTSEDIDDVISLFFTVVYANSRWKMASDRFVYLIERKLHGGLKIWIWFSLVKNNINLLLTRCLVRKILFLPLENKIHTFSPPCNILYVCVFQREYYATHQCFLSHRSLYIAMWKVTDGEQGVNKIEPWLLNIQVRVLHDSFETKAGHCTFSLLLQFS